MLLNMDLFEGMDNATAAIIIQLQLEDAEGLIDRKGKGREGELSDAQVTLELLREDVQRHTTTVTDRVITKAIVGRSVATPRVQWGADANYHCIVRSIHGQRQPPPAQPLPITNVGEPDEEQGHVQPTSSSARPLLITAAGEPDEEDEQQLSSSSAPIVGMRDDILSTTSARTEIISEDGGVDVGSSTGVADETTEEVLRRICIAVKNCSKTTILLKRPAIMRIVVAASRISIGFRSLMIPSFHLDAAAD
ncbi:hypothetical protein B0O99DRAFT_208102 [Bisporella sp. PMI_857]|nr:hypothetical protein B0O99DRAFT_208102 [Bisporella sp. PMI_857]